MSNVSMQAGFTSNVVAAFPKVRPSFIRRPGFFCNAVETVTTAVTRLDVFDNVQGEKRVSLALVDNIAKSLLYQVHAVFLRLQFHLCLF